MNTRRSAFGILRRLMQARIPARTEGPPSGGWCVPTSGEEDTIVRIHTNKAHEITAVTFGGVAVKRFYPVGDNEIECVIDYHANGVVDVQLLSALGAETLTDAFTYTAGVVPAVITSINYSQGDPLGGGQSIVITGTGFTDVNAVDFGGSAALYAVDSETQITAMLPAHAVGDVDLVVANAAGDSNALTFKYWDPSQLASTTGFWENYTGAPWVARAGSVGGKLNAPGTVGLSIGAGAGGFSSAQFVGGGGNNGRFQSSAPDTIRPIDAFIAQQGSGLTASTAWVLAKPTSQGAAYSPGAPYLDRALLGTDAGGYFILSHNPSGFLGNVYDGSYDAVIAPCSLGTGTGGLNAWHMAVFRMTTTVSQISVDGSLLAAHSTSQNLSSSVSLPYTLQVGTDYSGGNQFGGEILAFGVTKGDVNDTEVGYLRAWAAQRFGVTV